MALLTSPLGLRRRNAGREAAIIPNQRDSSENHPSTVVIPRLAHLGKRVVSYTEERPLEKSDNKSIILVNGLAAPEEAYALLRHELAIKSGRSVFTFRPLRYQHRNPLHPQNILHADEAMQKSVWAVTKDIITRDKEARIGIIGHSMGGLATAKSVLHLLGRPVIPRQMIFKEAVSSVTLHAAAGSAYPTPSFWEMRSRMTDMFAHEVWPNRSEIRAQSRETGLGRAAIVHNIHFLQLLGEMRGCLGQDIAPIIEEIQDAGIPVASITYPRDALFPPDEVAAGLGPTGAALFVLNSHNAGHLADQLLAAEVADQQMVIERQVFNSPAA